RPDRSRFRQPDGSRDVRPDRQYRYSEWQGSRPCIDQEGERVRVRIVNAALARIVALHFEGHNPVVVAYDGQPCDPHPPEGGRVVLGPAMRADLIIDMAGKPGQSYRG